MKLELKHLAPYLPYGLKCSIHSELFPNPILTGINGIFAYLNYHGANLSFEIEKIKPILRPLSDYADIDSDALCDINCDMSDQIQISEFASKRISLSAISVSAYNICLSNHIDVFGLIDQGLALPLI